MPEFTARKSPPKPQGHLPRFTPARAIAIAIALPLTALLLTSCTSAPPWYTIGDTPAGILHGLGQGETREQARARALSSLAEQLEVSIRSETRLTTRGDAESSSLSVEHEVETRTNILIRGAEILREERRDGRWYLLCRYDSRPLRVRVGEKLSPEKHSSAGWSLPLTPLPFSRFLKENALPPSFHLNYKNDLWRLSVNSHTLPVSDNELAAEFFFPATGKHVTLIPGHLNGAPVTGQAPNTLRKGQHYTLELSVPASGYASVFYVDNSGIVLALAANQSVLQGQTVILPNPSLHPSGYIAEPAAGHRQSTDMILILYTAAPQENLSRYQAVSEHSADTANHALYSYGQLLNDISQMELLALGALTARVADEKGG